MLKDVVAGIIQRGDGCFLLSERRQGKHLAGLLEFPGGKIEASESPFAALQRELNEELGITVNNARPLITFRQENPDFDLQIEFWRITEYYGQVQERENQALQWLALADIDASKMPDINAVVLRALSLPDHYAITAEPLDGTEAFLQRVQHLIRTSGVRMLQLRAKTMAADQVAWLTAQMQPLCMRYSTTLLINSAVEIARRFPAVGVHLTASQLYQYRSRPLPLNSRVGASCHTAAELAQAAAMGADFATLGPIRHTHSHPDTPGIGWEGFRALSANALLPVYALGGTSRSDTTTAWLNGGQGIAAIRNFWNDN